MKPKYVFHFFCAFHPEISHWLAVGKSAHALEKLEMKTKNLFLLPALIGGQLLNGLSLSAAPGGLVRSVGCLVARFQAI